MRCWPDLALLMSRVAAQPDEVAAKQLIRRLALAERSRRPVVVAFLNQHGFNLACRQRDFRNALLRSDLLLRDGIGLKWAMRWLGMVPGINMNGTDFIPLLVRAMLRAHPGCSLHLYGTQEPWLSKAAHSLRDSESRDIYVMDGFQSEKRYVESVRKDCAAFKLVVLGMGMPRQELVAQHLRQVLSGPALIICGGAILDFMADRVPRAPRLLRENGLEWAYRLLREPRRLFRRYVIGIPLFVCRVLALMFGLKGGARHAVAFENGRQR